MTDVETQAPAEPTSKKVAGKVRLKCRCWWSWKALDEADYIFPRDMFDCANEGEDGLPHGQQEVVSVRMYSHSHQREVYQLTRAAKKAAAAKAAALAAQEPVEEPPVKPQEPLGPREPVEVPGTQPEVLAELVAALGRGETPVMSRRQRAALRDAGLKL